MNHESRIMEKQKDLFKQYVELALEVKKPLMIHCRDPVEPSAMGHSAYDDLLVILDSYFIIHDSIYPGNMHFFSGTWDIAEEFLKRGFTLSVGGPITFPAKEGDKRQESLVEVVRKVPLDKLMAETDSPFVAPVPYRGKRNEPMYVGEVVKKIAEIRGEDFETVRVAMVENATKYFRLNE
jgi:TatD DNase family protein